jgi:hypothetical protein
VNLPISENLAAGVCDIAATADTPVKQITARPENCKVVYTNVVKRGDEVAERGGCEVIRECDWIKFWKSGLFFLPVY